jgi:hypothetical protein
VCIDADWAGVGGRLSGRSKTLDQVAGIDAESLGDAKDVGQSEVALTPLDLPDVGEVEADLLGELLLGEAECEAMLPHSGTKLCCR